MKKNKRKIFIIITILIVIIIIILCIILKKDNKTKLVSIKSQKELEKIYEGGDIELNYNLLGILTMPFSFSEGIFDRYDSINYTATDYKKSTYTPQDILDESSVKGSSNSIVPSIIKEDTESIKDYSTTNIQVENVDEADITKTDGDYIYSISDENVIITDVRNPEKIEITKKIEITEGIPEDLILYKNKLTVISYTIGYSNQNTMVYIYNIENKQKPVLEKSYTLYEPYYTSRCINNKLYVISSGVLRKENNEINTYYTEDRNKLNIELKDIKYLKGLETDYQTLISFVNLDDIKEKINVKSYLMNIENAYISENNIYLLDNGYYDSYDKKISDLFGWKGILGLFDEDESNDLYSGSNTNIYKFHIQDDGNIEYENNAFVEGNTINQFSTDEYKENLRLAVKTNNGSKVIVLDNNLKKIGETPYLAKGEKMYSSRFLGDKAYLVTYQTIDPLFVIDISIPSNPKVLGELKIPGYSTYLHPYDENHLIGIGMQTEETINKNSLGKVISKTAKITGMKMALFDVSDVNNPIQISDTVIGDNRATSSILTNHKALLFSKEKELIAIPVNNYDEDFEILGDVDNYDEVISNYTNYSKKYISEGYFVYKINLKDGFSLKGVVNHEELSKKTYNDYGTTRLLRGLYIEDKLFTISEEMIKVNNLDDLSIISELKIKGGN